MRTGMIIFILFIFKSLSAQDAGTKYHFKEVGWTIILPMDFKVLDSAEDAAKNTRGIKLLEDANEIEIDVSQTKTLIAATKTAYNYFNSTIAPFDAKKVGDYNTSAKSVTDMLYRTFQEKIPGAKIDSASSLHTIDGLTFNKFHITINIKDGVLLNMLVLYKHYKGYDFGISYVYMDKQTKEQIETMLRSSRFTR